MSMLQWPSKAAVVTVQGFIKAYQYTISPLLGQCCRFEPSCSTYSEEAFAKHGFIKGLWLTVIRVAKCGPFHEGGYDPVPQAKSAPKCGHKPTEKPCKKC